jgi:hypothetical protein
MTGGKVKIKTVGYFKYSHSFAHDITGKVRNEGFDAAWNAIPMCSEEYDYEEIKIFPTIMQGNRGIFINKQTVVKFFINQELKEEK